MKVNSIIRLVVPPFDDEGSKGSVRKGALALCVDGEKKFPTMYKAMVKSISKECVDDEFVWIEWIKEDPNYEGRVDGAYSKYRFVEVLNKELN